MVPQPPQAEDPDDARYREIVETARIGIFASRPDGRLITCNPAFARILGFDSVADALATDMATIYDDPAQREALLNRLRERGALERVTVRLRRRDGRTIRGLGTVIGAFTAGELTELRGFLIDIPEGTDDEADPRERDGFHSLFMDAADAMFILDADRRIVEANRAAAALFGESSQALAGRRLDDVIVDGGEPIGPAWQELLAFGEARREHRFTQPGRPPRVIEASYRTSPRAGGRHLWTGRDITGRRTIEDRIMQAERIESVGRLAGGVAHDFNNLLTAILGYTELLLNARPRSDRDRADLEEIQKAGQRAAALTQQLLAYSRRQVLMPKDVDLNHTVAGLRDMITRLIPANVTLTIQLAPRPALVRIDPTQLEQVILNLVMNARDALPQGGEVRVEIAHVGLADEEIPVEHRRRSSEYIRLRVIDNGLGIAPEVQAHLFEPFFTTKEVGKGTGLGLASVHGIVNQSHGFISVASEPGRGAQFSMYFPAAAGAVIDDAVVSASMGRETPVRETILLVEDEDAVRAIAGAALRRHGYRVLEAATPRGACAIFEQHRDEIDLLLTDVVMPDMNGPALADQLTAIRPSLRVLFISGYADASPVRNGNPGMGFLGKPFHASVLVGRVGEILSRGAR
jgi:two-component system, cell cycle sensor histidine kinase and response regulator CckA